MVCVFPFVRVWRLSIPPSPATVLGRASCQKTTRFVRLCSLRVPFFHLGAHRCWMLRSGARASIAPCHHCTLLVWGTPAIASTPLDLAQANPPPRHQLLVTILRKRLTRSDTDSCPNSTRHSYNHHRLPVVDLTRSTPPSQGLRHPARRNASWTITCPAFHPNLT